MLEEKYPWLIPAKELQTFLIQYIDNHYSKNGYTIGAVSIYPSQEKVVVAIDVLKTKSLKKKASIYLWGVPKYNKTTQEIYLDDLAFIAKSKNILLKFAQWFINPNLLARLKNNTRFGLSDKLKELQKQLSDFKIEDELGTLIGKFDYVDISKVFVSKTDFEVYLQAQGDLGFDMKWWSSLKQKESKNEFHFCSLD